MTHVRTTPRASGRLLRSRQFREIFEGALDAMLLADDEARYVDGNPAALALLGVTLEKLRTMRVEDLSKLPPGVSFEDAWAAFKKEGRAEGEIMLVRPDGKTLVVEFRAKASISPGLHLSILRDVTSLRRIPELEDRTRRAEQLATLGMLAAGLIHEIRNPATVVLGSLELIQLELTAGDLPAQPGRSSIPELLAQATEAAGHLVTLVRDVRLLTPVRSDDSSAVDIHAVIESTLRMVSAQLKAGAVRVRREYGDVPAVRGSAPRIAQILLNIVLNSTQAMASSPGSTHELDIKTRVEPGSGRVVIEIGDNGPGIGPEAMAQLFVPFFTTKSSSLGTGLGLAIARSIATELGGHISVASEPGNGAVFMVSLCAHAVDTRPAAAAELG